MLRRKNMKCPKCNKTKIGTEGWLDFFTPKRELCWGGHPMKVSDLEEISIEEISAEDLILISDMSEKKSKAISIKTLKKIL